MASSSPALESGRATAAPDLIAGVVLEVKDLAASRAFYNVIFAGAGGQWREIPGGLAYATPNQRLELARRSRPRPSGEGAFHCAFRVGSGSRVAEALAAAGHAVHWWREDHSAEREVSAYADDPSGNRVQLVSAEPRDLLLDHVGLDFVDLDYAEDFYVKGLGGGVDSYYGMGSGRGSDMRAWMAGDDPCAPWTRTKRFSFRSRTMEGHNAPQLFVGFGDTRIGLFLALQHRQEPPEEFLKGTPRVILHSEQQASQVVADLEGPARDAMTGQFSGRTISFQKEGSTIFLRDPGGNYVELECSAR